MNMCTRWGLPLLSLKQQSLIISLAKWVKAEALGEEEKWKVSIRVFLRIRVLEGTCTRPFTPPGLTLLTLNCTPLHWGTFTGQPLCGPMLELTGRLYKWTSLHQLSITFMIFISASSSYYPLLHHPLLHPLPLCGKYSYSIGPSIKQAIKKKYRDRVHL